MKLRELAFELRALKDLRTGKAPMFALTTVQEADRKAALKKSVERFSRDLGALDLGLEWDDTNEMYVVYDLDSRKD